MYVKWGWFKTNKRVYADRAEQKFFAQELGLPERAYYVGEEAEAIYQFAMREMRRGNARWTFRE